MKEHIHLPELYIDTHKLQEYLKGLYGLKLEEIKEENTMNQNPELDFDYITQYLKNKGWGDTVINEFENFEKSSFYNNPSDAEKYAKQMHNYLYALSTRKIEEKNEFAKGGEFQLYTIKNKLYKSDSGLGGKYTVRYEGTKQGKHLYRVMNPGFAKIELLIPEEEIKKKIELIYDKGGNIDKSWNRKEVEKLVYTLGQNAYRFKDDKHIRSQGDYGQVNFEIKDDPKVLYAYFETPEKAQEVVNLFTQTSTPPYEFVWDSAGRTDTVKIGFSRETDIESIHKQGGALKEGIKIEKEHKDLYKKLKNRLKKEGVLMPISEKEFYSTIAKAHLKEEKNYYDLLKKYVENKKDGGELTPSEQTIKDIISELKENNYIVNEPNHYYNKYNIGPFTFWYIYEHAKDEKFAQQIYDTMQEEKYIMQNEKGGEVGNIIPSEITKYSFKKLQSLFYLSDSNNPNVKSRHDAEKILTQIGFYDKEGHINEILSKKYTTSDGKTLQDLSDWVETQMAKGGDINDPVLLRIRAERLANKTDNEKKKINFNKRIYGKHREQIENEIRALQQEIKDLQQEKKQLFIEQEIEAGTKGDKWSDIDANRYGELLNTIETKIENLQKKLISKQGKLLYAKGGDIKNIIIPSIIKKEDLGEYEYIGGGNKELEEYIGLSSPNVALFKLDNYVGIVPSSNMKEWILFPKEYFKYNGEYTWYKEDINIDDFKDLPIKIVGQEKENTMQEGVNIGYNIIIPEYINFKQFPYKEAIFQPNTLEYIALNSLNENEWEHYLLYLANNNDNISIEYNNKEDEFVITNSTGEGTFLGTPVYRKGGRTPKGGTKAQEKVHEVMKEFKNKTLTDRWGHRITDRDQAIAIALSKAGLSRDRHDYNDGRRMKKGGNIDYDYLTKKFAEGGMNDSLILMFKNSSKDYERLINDPTTPTNIVKNLKEKKKWIDERIAAYDRRERKKAKKEPIEPQVTAVEEKVEEVIVIEEPRTVGKRAHSNIFERIREEKSKVAKEGGYYIDIEKAYRVKVKDAMWYRKIKPISERVPGTDKVRLIVKNEEDLDFAYKMYSKFAKKMGKKPKAKEDITGVFKLSFKHGASLKTNKMSKGGSSIKGYTLAQLKQLKQGDKVISSFTRGTNEGSFILLEPFKKDKHLSDATGSEFYTAYALSNDKDKYLVQIDWQDYGQGTSKLDIDDGWSDDWINMSNFKKNSIAKKFNLRKEQLPQEEYAKGGELKNYKDSYGNPYSEQQVWDFWSVKQKAHFLKYHAHLFTSAKFKDIGLDRPATWKDIAKYNDYVELPHLAKMALREHIEEGQYAKGGKINLPIEKAEKEYNELKRFFDKLEEEQCKQPTQEEIDQLSKEMKDFQQQQEEYKKMSEEEKKKYDEMINELNYKEFEQQVELGDKFKRKEDLRLYLLSLKYPMGKLHYYSDSFTFNKQDPTMGTKYTITDNKGKSISFAEHWGTMEIDIPGEKTFTYSDTEKEGANVFQINKAIAKYFGIKSFDITKMGEFIRQENHYYPEDPMGSPSMYMAKGGKLPSGQELKDLFTKVNEDAKKTG